MHLRICTHTCSFCVHTYTYMFVYLCIYWYVCIISVHVCNVKQHLYLLFVVKWLHCALVGFTTITLFQGRLFWTSCVRTSAWRPFSNVHILLLLNPKHLIIPGPRRPRGWFGSVFHVTSKIPSYKPCIFASRLLQVDTGHRGAPAMIKAAATACWRLV